MYNIEKEIKKSVRKFKNNQIMKADEYEKEVRRLAYEVQSKTALKTITLISDAYKLNKYYKEKLSV